MNWLAPIGAAESALVFCTVAKALPFKRGIGVGFLIGVLELEGVGGGGQRESLFFSNSKKLL